MTNGDMLATDRQVRSGIEMIIEDMEQQLDGFVSTLFGDNFHSISESDRDCVIMAVLWLKEQLSQSTIEEEDQE